MRLSEKEREKVASAKNLIRRNQILLPILMLLVLFDLAAFLIGLLEAETFGLLMLLLAALGIRRPWEGSYPSYEELTSILSKQVKSDNSGE